jgi:putative hemolysin
VNEPREAVRNPPSNAEYVMKVMSFFVFGALVVTTAACTAETESPDQHEAAIGLANPAATHCVELGHSLVDEQCVFSDGTSCEQWAFYRGECGPDAGPTPGPTPDPSPTCGRRRS